ncbi:MAG: hypothetical protein OER95_03535 [Acidimicrobiia bacterium]|nr:hypothetical protein [Acidimicrobiia bacterium]
MPSTLAEVLSKDRVEFDELQQSYNPVLKLVNVLIGVVPNCDRYLEIWPPGFLTYNLMVPNFLNLPAGLLGLGAPKDIVGLAMYTSSRAAECMYCSAHTCSYALRRGSSADAVTGASRTEAQAAAVAVAEALSTVPHSYTPDLGDRLRQHFSAEDAEWIAMSVAMMGFLNKFMDAIGVELEAASVDDVADLIEPTGWSVGQHGWAEDFEGGAAGADPDGGAGAANPPTDSVGTMLRVFRNAPGAFKLERRWMAGLPKGGQELRSHIATNYHLDEPLLTTMGHTRVVRALAAMLRHNLDPEQSDIGLATKALVGLVFAEHVGNRHLLKQATGLARHHGVADDVISAARSYRPGSELDGLDGVDDKVAAAIATAYDIAPSPSAVRPEVIDLAQSVLTAAETVEIAVWVSVCQLMHRLSVFFQFDEA